MEIIDTHIHIWDLENIEYEWLKGDTSILGRTHTIDEIEDERKQVGVTGGVFVQAANNFDDTNWMISVAKERDWLLGVVGWLPLMDPEATEKVLKDRYLQEPYFKGMRHLIHDEKDPEWLLQEPVIESLKMLEKHDIPFDVVGILNEHIETVLKVAEKVPQLRMVFDHSNQPPIPKKEKFGKWGELMEEAAKNRNFHTKISGLGTASGDFENWSGEDIKPYVDFLIKTFGEDRCFCGGDWPVSKLAGSYTQTWQIYKDVLQSLLDESGQERVFHQSAKNYYNLK